MDAQAAEQRDHRLRRRRDTPPRCGPRRGALAARVVDRRRTNGRQPRRRLRGAGPARHVCGELLAVDRVGGDRSEDLGDVGRVERRRGQSAPARSVARRSSRSFSVTAWVSAERLAGGMGLRPGRRRSRTDGSGAVAAEGPPSTDGGALADARRARRRRACGRLARPRSTPTAAAEDEADGQARAGEHRCLGTRHAEDRCVPQPGQRRGAEGERPGARRAVEDRLVDLADRDRLSRRDDRLRRGCCRSAAWPPGRVDGHPDRVPHPARYGGHRCAVPS